MFSSYSDELNTEEQFPHRPSSREESADEEASQEIGVSLPDTKSRGLEGVKDLDILTAFNLLRTTAALSPYLDSALRDVKLTGAQLNVLLALRDAGENGLALGEIGRHLVVTRGNITGLIDRLERDGLVARSASSDRRVTIAKLTSRGRALIDEATPRQQRALEDLLEIFTQEEKQSLISILTRIRRRLRESRGIGAETLSSDNASTDSGNNSRSGPEAC